MENGVNGHLGVVVMEIIRRYLEQETVTIQHLVIEVPHVLGLHGRKINVLQVIFIQYQIYLITVFWFIVV